MRLSALATSIEGNLLQKKDRFSFHLNKPGTVVPETQPVHTTLRLSRDSETEGIVQLAGSSKGSQRVFGSFTAAKERSWSLKSGGRKFESQ
jgi:hypothetical protein